MPGIVDRSLAIGVPVMRIVVAGTVRDEWGEFGYSSLGPRVAPTAFMQAARGVIASFADGQDSSQLLAAVRPFAPQAAHRAESPGPAFALGAGRRVAFSAPMVV